MTDLHLIDTHCHLDFDDFTPDRDQVLARCRKNNVLDIINPAVSAATWGRTIDVCQQSRHLHLALGLHPMFIAEHQPQHLNALDRAVEQHRPIAVGEIGLDFYNKKLDSFEREKQIAFFTKQLIIASQHDLPVIIHNRKAHDECLKLLAECPVKGGIIHAFNGSLQHAEKYAEMGFCLGFGGMLTYERSTRLRQLIKQVPLNSIVLETDAPDMAVAMHRGQRNSPEYLPYVLTAVAEITGQSSQDIARITTANTRRVFKLPCFQI